MKCKCCNAQWLELRYDCPECGGAVQSAPRARNGNFRRRLVLIGLSAGLLSALAYNSRSVLHESFSRDRVPHIVNAEFKPS